ncbi:CHASE2 domain-containing protein [Hydrogenimonas urashimensis]|uniref:CHASE2 domain-containing protein n=1 Tax=Hydrogenimonas urashimensis TaxID=2740515 RepID=UPI001916B065|nr:adenylate/guanylate cyclase domain-containing protein [Hydrogenimonas urashimensis]
MRKKRLFIFLIALIVVMGVLWGYLYHNETLLPFDKKLTDTLFKIRGPQPASDDIVIVDIDEKSLHALGQWPWPRIKIARILRNLAEAEAAVIGFDIVFSEPDNSSPKRVFEAYGIHDRNVPDYDLLLARAVSESPTILGFFFDFEAQGSEPGDIPEIPALFIEHNKPMKRSFILEAQRIVPNIPVIQNSAYSSGFFNTLPDLDGIVRSVPLLIRYDGMLFPSISLEMVRAMMQSGRIDIDYSESGVAGIRMGTLHLPTDRFGRLTVNYRGPGKSYTYLSAADIYDRNFDAEKIRGKIVLIGTSASGLLDLRATPFDSTFPGVEVHATAIDNMINGDFVTVPDWVEAADTTLLLALALITILIFSYAPPLATVLLSLSLFVAFFGFDYYLFANRHILLNMAFPTLLIILLFLVLSMFNYLFETRVKEKIREKFAKKVSPQVVDALLQNGISDAFETQQKEVTIFFSDIRSFTSISEALGDPKQLVDLLNRYLTPMANIIMDRFGTIDKFIGDAIMAYWNAPKEHPNHEDAAAKSALLQLEALKKLNHTLSREGLPTLDIGIGIHTGLVTVGEMGSAGRSDYTIMGDNVNLASRIEGLNKFYGSRLIISESTKRGLKEDYTFRELDTVRVKGRKKPVTIYELLQTGKPSKQLHEELEEYHHALEEYKNGNFVAAEEKFRHLQKKNPHPLYALYISRCHTYALNPPQHFDGIFVFETK